MHVADCCPLCDALRVLFTQHCLPPSAVGGLRSHSKMTRYAFSFDSSTCSGCKACQVACKDKHNLPVGTLWRQVYEVAGGGWTCRGDAWQSDVFAYHLSLACNHCVRPICVEICPANAITQRADGVVLLDSERCLGCRYCSWACPYNAPQYDPVTGRMSKCDLCVDEFDRGVPPVCVAACPLRALELITDHPSDANSDPAIFPLPELTLTAPALQIKPHPRAAQAKQNAAHLDGLGRVEPREGYDFSLVAFTILAQLAVGAFAVLCLFSLTVRPDALPNRVAIGVVASMLLGLFASLFHLGSLLQAWRALAHWRSSWVSREILFALLFATSTVVFAVLDSLRVDERGAAAWFAVLLGFGLIYSMASAYSLRTVPAWSTPFTFVSFVITSLLLGLSGVAAIAAWVGFDDGARSQSLGVVALVIVQWAVVWLWLDHLNRGGRAAKAAWARITRAHRTAFIARFCCSLSGIVTIGATLLTPNATLGFALGFAFLASSEVIGRYLFYRMRVRVGI